MVPKKRAKDCRDFRYLAQKPLRSKGSSRGHPNIYWRSDLESAPRAHLQQQYTVGPLRPNLLSVGEVTDVAEPCTSSVAFLLKSVLDLCLRKSSLILPCIYMHLQYSCMT